MILFLLKIKLKHVNKKGKKIKDNVGLELLNLASQISIDNHKNITREQVAKENTDADDARK
jgi:hypothetical protein